MFSGGIEKQHQVVMVICAEKTFLRKEDILCLEGYSVGNLRSWKYGWVMSGFGFKEDISGTLHMKEQYQMSDFCFKS